MKKLLLIAASLIGCILLFNRISRQSKDYSYVDFSVHPISIRTHEEERLYRKAMSRFAWVTKTMVILTTVFTALAASFAAWSALEANRQADAADESNRPWLQVQNLESVGFILHRDGHNTMEPPFSTNTVRYFFRAVIKNIGKSPAKDVRLFATLTYRGKRVDWTFCAKKADEKPFLETVQFIFPDVEKRHAFVKDELLAEIETRLTKNDKEVWQVAKPDVLSDERDLNLSVFGCIAYLDARGKRHFTGFGYDLGQANISPTGPPRDNIIVQEIESSAFAN